MIQVYKPGLDFDFAAERRRDYDMYMAERKKLSINDLQAVLEKYDAKSRFGKLVHLLFSDSNESLRIKATRQVLTEKLKEL